MNATQILFSSALVLAAAGAMADDITIARTSATSALTRADVTADLQRARAAGELLAPGERYDGAPVSTTSTVARADVKAQVAAAEAAHQLMPAGEGRPDDPSLQGAPSTLTRADVKEQNLAARRTGQLLPAGDSAYPDMNAAQRQAARAQALRASRS